MPTLASSHSVRNGGPAPEAITNRVYDTLSRFPAISIDHADIDLDSDGSFRLGDTEVVFIDPLVDYTALMEGCLTSEALRSLFKSGFRMTFDAMNAVTGPYARKIIEERLGASAGTVINAEPLPDFGGLHPDQIVNAAELVALMNARRSGPWRSLRVMGP